MSATVGELVVNLVARTAAFNQGLQQSQQQVTTFAQRASSAGATVAGMARQFLPVVGIAAGVTMAFRNMHQTLMALDDLGDNAAKLGVLPRELVALEIAAEKSGTSVGTLHSAMGRLQKNLGEAASTGKGVTKVLEELGLNAKTLAAAGPAEAMAAIGKALENIENQADGARIKMELFGKAGLDAGAALKGLAEAQANVKHWDLGSPTAVTLGGSYEDMMTQAGYAKRSLAEKIWSGAVAIGRILGAVGDFGHGMEGMEQEYARIQDEIAASTRPSMAGPTTAAQRLEYRMGRFADMDRAREVAEIRTGQRMAMEADAFAKQAADQAAAFAKKLHDREQQVAQIIRGQLTAKGGDGAELAPLATMGSLAAYQALARHGMQTTAKKTDEEIAQSAKQQLDLLRGTDRRVERIATAVEKMSGDGVMEIPP